MIFGQMPLLELRKPVSHPFIQVGLSDAYPGEVQANRGYDRGKSRPMKVQALALSKSNCNKPRRCAS